MFWPRHGRVPVDIGSVRGKLEGSDERAKRTSFSVRTITVCDSHSFTTLGGMAEIIAHTKFGAFSIKATMTVALRHIVG